jgi:hypothetical protein
MGDATCIHRPHHRPRTCECTSEVGAIQEAVYVAVARDPLATVSHVTCRLMVSSHARPSSLSATPRAAVAET